MNFSSLSDKMDRLHEECETLVEGFAQRGILIKELKAERDTLKYENELLWKTANRLLPEGWHLQMRKGL